MPTIEELLEELSQLDVGFYCHHTTAYGSAEIPLSPSGVMGYRRDPAGFVAAHYGISKANYLAWHVAGYSVLCAGTTKAGRPCKNVVEGGSALGPREWVALQGSYCHLHY
jgi:hypothetical protein